MSFLATKKETPEEVIQKWIRGSPTPKSLFLLPEKEIIVGFKNASTAEEFYANFKGEKRPSGPTSAMEYGGVKPEEMLGAKDGGYMKGWEVPYSVPPKGKEKYIQLWLFSYYPFGWRPHNPDFTDNSDGADMLCGVDCIGTIYMKSQVDEIWRPTYEFLNGNIDANGEERISHIADFQLVIKRATTLDFNQPERAKYMSYSKYGDGKVYSDQQITRDNTLCARIKGRYVKEEMTTGRSPFGSEGDREYLLYQCAPQYGITHPLTLYAEQLYLYNPVGSKDPNELPFIGCINLIGEVFIMRPSNIPTDPNVEGAVKKYEKIYDDVNNYDYKYKTLEELNADKEKEKEDTKRALEREKERDRRMKEAEKQREIEREKALEEERKKREERKRASFKTYDPNFTYDRYLELQEVDEIHRLIRLFSEKSHWNIGPMSDNENKFAFINSQEGLLKQWAKNVAKMKTLVYPPSVEMPASRNTMDTASWLKKKGNRELKARYYAYEEKYREWRNKSDEYENEGLEPYFVKYLKKAKELKMIRDEPERMRIEMEKMGAEDPFTIREKKRMMEVKAMEAEEKLQKDIKTAEYKAKHFDKRGRFRPQGVRNAGRPKVKKPEPEPIKLVISEVEEKPKAKRGRPKKVVAVVAPAPAPAPEVKLKEPEVKAKKATKVEGNEGTATPEKIARVSDMDAVKRIANRLLGDKYNGNVPIELSTRKGQKYMLAIPNTRGKIHFGDLEREDFTKHKDEKRRADFQKRNAKWKDAEWNTPAWLSYHLLW